MRVVFMGTPSYAVPALVALCEHHDVVGVFTRPDAPSQRGSKLIPSEVKVAAIDRGISVYTPRSLKDADALDLLESLRPDVVVVAAYGLILPQRALESAPFGCLNLHASLLPRWRGAAPIQRAILAGDEYAGVALMRMEAGLDTGDFALARKTLIAEKTTDELTAELAALGAEIIIEGLRALEDGSLVWERQDEALVTYAEKISKADVALTPQLSARELARRVRASSHSAPSRLQIAQRAVTALSVRVLDDPVELGVSPETVAPGEVYLTKKRVGLGCSDGVLELLTLRPDGKRSMDARAFFNGLGPQATLVWDAI